MLRRGREENLPYSLSRWTDVPGSPNKWAWFRLALARGEMVAFGPTSTVPDRWSLIPRDTLGLVFWTKDPTRLLADSELLRPYRVKVHVTLTGWEEVEKGAPSIDKGIELLCRTLDVFGPEHVTWRFSPVPLVADVAHRFDRIATAVRARQVFLAFLQENDRLPESRTVAERRRLLLEFARISEPMGTRVLLCNDDRSLLAENEPCIPSNLALGVCDPAEFAEEVEACGCRLAVDPFTINESCFFACSYCYAADKGLSPRKRNTMRGLPVVP